MTTQAPRIPTTKEATAALTSLRECFAHIVPGDEYAYQSRQFEIDLLDRYIESLESAVDEAEQYGRENVGRGECCRPGGI